MTEIVVAGGGLAGAAAASALARAGIPVTLIERQAQPVDKICGEFLSTEAQTYLAKLGLDLGGFGAAPISKLRMVRGAQSVATDLPFAGIGLSRRRLDEALLQHAAASGVHVLRGRNIRNLDAGARISLDVEGEGRLTPEILLLATGKHDLRGAGRVVKTRHDLVGFKMNFRLGAEAQAALQHYIELIFFSGGYAGLQLIENGVANLCLLVRRKRFMDIGGNWNALLDELKTQSPHLADRLANGVELWKQPLTIYRVPYGFIHRHVPGDPPQLYRLGDQACVIHSFTGDGMAIALHSAALATRILLRQKDAGIYHRQLARDIGGQMQRADALSALLNNAVTQKLMFGMARLMPCGLQKAAALTRVPLQARL